MVKVTQILHAIEKGDPSAADQLLPIVYGELRRLAKARMAKESPDQTLQATALVHEAYLRLVGSENDQHWDSRGHFFAAAAQSMRQILVENARRKQSLRRGGKVQRQAAEVDGFARPEPDRQLLELDDAMKKLSLEKPVVSKLVELKYFAGLTLDEAAASLGISSRTADSYWAYAKAWLRQEMQDATDA
jgi:RNA polymerase sigma factor (TIGR02999 family)